MTVHEFLLPDLGEGIAEVEVVQWFAEPGDLVVAHQALVEVETDKAIVELPAPVDGVLIAHGAAAGEMIKLGEPVASFEVAPGVSDSGSRPLLFEPAPPAGVPLAARPLATPAIRQLARDKRVDLTLVVGSGDGGRVLREDVERAAGAIQAAPPVDGMAEQEPASIRVPLRGLRRTIARRMTETLRTVPQVTNMFEADVTELGAVLEKLRPVAKAQGAHLTWTALFGLATLHALRQFPSLNASLDEEHEEIVLHRRIHLGIATATDDGLLVPVVRNADDRSLLDLAGEIARLSDAARSRKLSAAELTGSTFTISNYGSVGGWFGTPVVNLPEIGVVGFGRVALRPAVVDGELAVRPLVAISTTVDHRLIDGATNAQFGTALRRLIEQPHLLLLGVPHGDG
jgi:pyruvate dehydrogenase E2 component (dihydrolipoamide acetyltransferase)